MEGRTANHKDEESDEVEDYMSNDFLMQIPDTRPGLVHSKIQAKKNETEKKHRLKILESNQKNLQQSSKNLEKVNREEALKKSTLTEENKGFSLMKKMGYKSGEALGRSKPSSNETKPNIEPISVEIKLDRGGLGQVEERKRKLKEIECIKKRICESRIHTEKHTAHAYLENKRAKFNLRKLIHSLHKCQKVCYQLDSSIRELKKPEVKWFWPINILKSLNQAASTEKSVQEPTEEETKDESTEVEGSQEQFYEKIMTTKETGHVDLQTVYEQRLESFIGCNETRAIDSKKSSDDEDEENNGYSVNYMNKVKDEKDVSDTSEKDNDEEEDENEFNEEVLRKKIDVVYSYLKENYFYCVWCATRYVNEEDMTKNCPGPTEDEHD